MSEDTKRTGKLMDLKIVEGYISCSRCGKRVSPDIRTVGDKSLVIRAWVECPECMEGYIVVERAPEESRG